MGIWADGRMEGMPCLICRLSWCLGGAESWAQQRLVGRAGDWESGG